MDRSQLVLASIRSFGYANLLALIFMLFSLKGGPRGSSIAMFFAPFLIATLGTAVYYCFWNRLFPSIDRSIGRTTMRPYILGFAITLSAIALVFSLGYYASHRSA